MKYTLTKMGSLLAKVSFGIVFSTLLFAQPLLAQEEDSKFSMNVSLNSDIFFGYYPFFAGSYELSDKLDFTFYGILWSGGTGGGWGNWTEFGIGVALPVAEGITVSPQIGLLNGSLTSGLGTPTLGEGFVPNLTITTGLEKFQSEIYLGYYVGLDKGNDNTNNYLHYWINGGYIVNGFFSAGVHFEQLRFMGGNNYPDDAAYTYYATVGPYVQFADPNGGAFARFTTGFDLRSDEEVTKSAWEQDNFFKLTVGWGF